MIATVEKGSTEWLARILKDGASEPEYFVPSGIYAGIAMSTRSFLERALQDTYPGIKIVDEAEFQKQVPSN